MKNIKSEIAIDDKKIQQIKITVIVPVYNAQNYLSRCLDSIVGQTYKNLEIILINDCSTDSSADIMAEYAAIDSRIHIVNHSHNMGLVRARKTGVSNATGEYISFVDADDEIELERCEELISQGANWGGDIICSDSVNIYPDGSQQRFNLKIKYGSYNRESIIKKILLNFNDTRYFHTEKFRLSMWCGLISTNLLKKCQPIIPDNITVGEDFACMLYCLLNANRVNVVSGSNYYYYRNINSMTSVLRHNNEYERNIDSSNRALCMVIKEYMKEVPKEIKEELYKHIKIHLYYNTLISQYSFLAKQINDGTIYPYGVKMASKIAIYGAGTLGRQMFMHLTGHCGICVVVWCDRAYKKFQAEGLQVSDPKALLQENFDYVIMAIGLYDSASKAAKSLVELGVEEKKICFMKVTELEKARLPIDDL